MTTFTISTNSKTIKMDSIPIVLDDESYTALMESLQTALMKFVSKDKKMAGFAKKVGINVEKPIVSKEAVEAAERVSEYLGA